MLRDLAGMVLALVALVGVIFAAPAILDLPPVGSDYAKCEVVAYGSWECAP